MSAREFFRIRPEIKRKYFWGGKLWTQSYFVEIIGNANKEVIRQYVQNQLKVMDEIEERFLGNYRSSKTRSLAAEFFICIS